MNKIWDLAKYNDNIAICDEHGVKVTYSEMNFRAEEITSVIGSRCLVFCLCKNEIGSVLGYSAFINTGIVPVMLSSHLDEALLRRLIDVYKPLYLWVPSDQVDQFSEMKEIYRVYQYSLLRSGMEKSYLLYEELALLLTTSGSTGSPKFVRQSYENVKDNAESIVKYLNLESSERPITTLPMNYTYGLSVINSHLMVGATILLTDLGLMQKEFWDFLKKSEATSFGGVPYTYEMLDKLRFYRMNLPSLRTMTQAGGKLIPELHERFARYAEDNGKKFVVMYGQCEATARMGYLPAEKAVEKKGSMGIAIPGGRFRLVDGDGQEIETPYTTGELVYEGRNVTLGYAEKGEDLALSDERHGVLETGDMAQFDEDGYYYIVGRKKRFLKIYGNRVNLDEIDRLIKSCFEIEAASGGVDDHMYIFVTNGNKANEVKEFVVSKTKLNPAAFNVVIIDEIPKNDSGKVLYQELSKYYKEDYNNGR